VGCVESKLASYSLPLDRVHLVKPLYPWGGTVLREPLFTLPGDGNYGQQCVNFYRISSCVWLSRHLQFSFGKHPQRYAHPVTDETAYTSSLTLLLRCAKRSPGRQYVSTMPFATPGLILTRSDRFKGLCSSGQRLPKASAGFMFQGRRSEADPIPSRHHRYADMGFLERQSSRLHPPRNCTFCEFSPSWIILLRSAHPNHCRHPCPSLAIQPGSRPATWRVRLWVQIISERT